MVNSSYSASKSWSTTVIIVGLPSFTTRTVSLPPRFSMRFFTSKKSAQKMADDTLASATMTLLAVGVLKSTFSSMARPAAHA